MEKQGSKNNGNSQIEDGLPLGDKSTPPYEQVDELSQEDMSYWRLLIVIVMSIFLAEVAAMILIYELPSLPYIYVTFIDAGVMTVLIFPILYFLSFQPLIRHLDSRRRAEAELRKAHEEMELRIKDRTEELRIANSELEEEITERRQAEKQIRERENELRLVMNTVPALISYLSPDFCYRRVNQSYEHWFGLKAETIEGRHVRDVLGESAWELIRPRLERAIAGEVVTYEEYMPYQVGGSRWIAGTLMPNRDATGDVQGLVIFVTDITEHKRLEQAIKDSEEKYRNIVRLAPAAIYEIDFFGRKLISINDTACEWLGYSREELFAIDPLTLMDEGGRLQFQQRIQQKLAGETISQTSEVKIHTKDGREIILEANVGQFTYKDDAPVSVLVVAHDVTERRRMEEQIRQAAREVQTANEELTRFNKSMVGRELRMIELKKEVNELCESLSQSPRYSPGFDSDEL